MSDLPAQSQFSTCACGSPSINIPAIIVDEAPISCGGCGKFIGSWLGYKRFVSRSIGLEGHGFQHGPLICVDPILTATPEDARAGF